LKIRNGWTKYILRQAIKGIIPEKIRLRKDKLAFDTPQDSWIRNEWRHVFIRAFTSDGLLPVFLKRKRLLEEFDAYLRRRSWLSGHFFFRSFILQKWAERFSTSSL
jgi:asparagine synthase (glutamine-hydrolysing)